MTRFSPIALGLMFAFSAHAADLLDVYMAAEQQDQVYAAAKATYNAGLERLPQARSALRPQVNLQMPLTYNYGRTDRAGDTISSGSDNYAAVGLTLSLTQALYRPENNIRGTSGPTPIDADRGAIGASATGFDRAHIASVFRRAVGGR